MSDDLEHILSRALLPAATPRLHAAPRVRGGPSLVNAPSLESGIAADSTRPLGPRGICVPAPEPPQLALRELDNSMPAAPATLRHPACELEIHQPGPCGHLSCTGLKKTYRKASAEISVLGGVDLVVEPGEFTAIIGQSGSGKSTLLHLLATLDAPDAGEVYFENQRIDNLPSASRDRLRNRSFGMIFQFYHLLPEMTTLENVLAPLMIGRSALDYFRHRREHRQSAARLLDMVGLGHRLKHTPRELSGGEMQRAAIARALVAGPRLLLADEPTGNLDNATGRGILELLRGLNREQNLTIVMVTHDQAIARLADRVVRLVDGRIQR